MIEFSLHFLSMFSNVDIFGGNSKYVYCDQDTMFVLLSCYAQAKTLFIETNTFQDATFTIRSESSLVVLDGQMIVTRVILNGHGPLQ
jgi:hypothetical protein